MPPSATSPAPVSGTDALREIAQALSAAWDLDTTLELIAHRTNHVMGVDSCSIYLLEPDGKTLRLRASTRLSRDALGRASLALGEGLTGWSAEHGESVSVRDAIADPRFKLLPETNEKALQSLLAVPLVNQGRIIGAMNVQTTALHNFSADETAMLSLIGDLAAGALDRAKLYDQMNRRLEELSTLAKISETVTSPMYPDEMLNLVVEMAAKAMNTPVCSLQLIDESKQELVMRAAWSQSHAYRNRPPLKTDKGIAGIVLREKKPIAVEDVRADSRYAFRDLAAQEGLVSLLSVPLTVREKSIGILNCYTDRRTAFTAEQVALLGTLANQTALAIENARLVSSAAVVREMHHRIKNNLQTVAMLLRMQTSRLAIPSANTKHSDESATIAEEILQTGICRILSIAAVHEVLAQEGFRLVDVKDVAERIVRLTTQHMIRPDLQINIRVEGESLILPSRPATSLALVINELLQNALEHAFQGRVQGDVRILLGHTPEGALIEITDDGIGLQGIARESLGWEIVRTLVRDDLNGTLDMRSNAAGTRIQITMPHPDTFREVE